MELLINNMQTKLEISEAQVELLQTALVRVLESEQCPIDAEVSIAFVDDAQIHDLNKEYRGKDCATDVLSFPMYETMDEIKSAGAGYMIGDIVISLETAARQATEFGHSFNRELVYLAVHSILHLLSYDHETEAEREVMRAKEEAIMDDIGLTR